MFTDKTKIREILADEDFAEFQEFLFPEMFVKNKLMRMLPLKVFDKVWSVESMVSGFQYMKNLRQRGEKLFYPIYDEKEAQKDPSLKQRVLFHFPVEGKTPFVSSVPAADMRASAPSWRRFRWRKLLIRRDITLLWSITAQARRPIFRILWRIWPMRSLTYWPTLMNFRWRRRVTR